MKNSLVSRRSVISLVFISLLLLLSGIMWLYNNLVIKEEATFETWAQVESNYQRRADLIPNMTRTVAKYLRYEKETLATVAGQRSAVMSADDFNAADTANFHRTVGEINEAQIVTTKEIQYIEGAPSDAIGLEKLQGAQEAIAVAMHRIMALVENYPVLHASEQIETLQAELAGSENRINVARMRYNEAAAKFNAAIRRVPARFVAELAGFERKVYFQAKKDPETFQQRDSIE